MCLNQSPFVSGEVVKYSAVERLVSGVEGP